MFAGLWLVQIPTGNLSTLSPLYAVSDTVGSDSEGSVSQDTVLIERAALTYGSRVQTEFNEYASVTFTDSSEIYISPQSDLTITSESYGGRGDLIRISLDFGGMILSIPAARNLQFEVEAGNSIAILESGSVGVQATGFYWIEQGRAYVMIVSSGQASSIGNGMFAQIDEHSSDIVTGRLTGDQIDQLRQLVRVRSEVPLNRSFTSYFISDGSDQQP